MEERQRMCIVCREMQDKRQLLRIVKTKEGEFFIDKTGKKNGRGAYICKREDCLNKLIKQKSLNKAFKTNISESFYQEIQEEILGNKQA